MRPFGSAVLACMCFTGGLLDQRATSARSVTSIDRGPKSILPILKHVALEKLVTWQRNKNLINLLAFFEALLAIRDSILTLPCLRRICSWRSGASTFHRLTDASSASDLIRVVAATQQDKRNGHKDCRAHNASVFPPHSSPLKRQPIIEGLYALFLRSPRCCLQIYEGKTNSRLELAADQELAGAFD